MSNARIITGTIGVWLGKHSGIGPYELVNADDAKLVRAITYSAHNIAPEWTRIGEAQVTITLAPNDQIINDKVESLRAEQTRVQAEATKRATQIEREIQSLLAITHEVAA